MAFDESLMMLTSFPILNEDNNDGLFHQTRNSLSRLSVCTSSVHDNDANDAAAKNKSDFGVFDGAEADGEVSDDRGGRKKNSDPDSDKELYSLPETPSLRRKKLPVSVSGEVDAIANESNGPNEDGGGSKCNLRRQRRVIKEKKKKKGGSDGNGNGGRGRGRGREALTVLTTRAKGGEKSLKMGLEEVKACRELGFELEVPGRISVSTGSHFDTQTSSGSNSPIATWRISSPGDDPKEVKARLKVWAQAVALASASRQA